MSFISAINSRTSLRGSWALAEPGAHWQRSREKDWQSPVPEASARPSRGATHTATEVLHHTTAKAGFQSSLSYMRNLYCLWGSYFKSSLICFTNSVDLSRKCNPESHSARHIGIKQLCKHTNWYKPSQLPTLIPRLTSLSKRLLWGF